MKEKMKKDEDEDNDDDDGDDSDDDVETNPIISSVCQRQNKVNNPGMHQARNHKSELLIAVLHRGKNGISFGVTFDMWCVFVASVVHQNVS